MNIEKLLKTPFDVISIPSFGVFYANKKNTLTVRYLTGKDEIFLTGPSLSESGKAIIMLLESVILDKDIKIKDLLVCDKNAVLIFLKSLTYGDELKFKIICPHCSKESETSFRLSSIEARDIIEMPDEEGCYSFVLPKYKFKTKSVTIKFKPLTVEMENKINEELSKDNSELKKIATTKMKYQIVNINNNVDIEFIEKFIKSIPIVDFTALKKYMEIVEPGFNNDIDLNCNICNKSFVQNLSIDNSFLGLASSYRVQVMEECFLAYYYGKGITRDNAYNMSVTERKWTVGRISDELEKKAKAEEAAMNQAKSKRK